jgi:hypothetical protein
MKQCIYFLVMFSIGFISCSEPFVKKELNQEIPLVSSTSVNENRKDSEANFPDFKNFRYPKFCLEGDKEPFLLKNGVFADKESGDEITFGRISYADVTGDDVDEAFVVLNIITGGSAMPHCVYIFSSENQKKEKVKLLWDFQTGDRADGGLRNIYRENGNLVIEKYISEEKSGDCCPKYFIKENYKWNNKIFEKQAEEKLLVKPN